MIEYEVRGFNRRGASCGFTVLAKDPKHAIVQVKELAPHIHQIKSVLPADEWK